MFQTFNLSHKQSLKPQDDKGEENDNNREFDVFAMELDSNWYDLILYDWTFKCKEF